MRRFTKRVYVRSVHKNNLLSQCSIYHLLLRMPDVETRTKLVTHLLEKQGAPLTAKEIAKVVTLTEGYTCR